LLGLSYILPVELVYVIFLCFKACLVLTVYDIPC
jgi:hypothetical protein